MEKISILLKTEGDMMMSPAEASYKILVFQTKLETTSVIAILLS